MRPVLTGGRRRRGAEPREGEGRKGGATVARDHKGFRAAQHNHQSHTRDLISGVPVRLTRGKKCDKEHKIVTLTHVQNRPSQRLKTHLQSPPSVLEQHTSNRRLGGAAAVTDRGLLNLLNAPLILLTCAKGSCHFAPYWNHRAIHHCSTGVAANQPSHVGPADTSRVRESRPETVARGWRSGREKQRLTQSCS